MDNNQEKDKMKLERRKFFGKLGKGAIGAFLLGLLPLSFWHKEKNAEQTKQNPQSKMKVAINPMAVKRNK